MGGSVASGGVVLMPTWKRALITGVQLTMTLITAGVIIGYGQLYHLLVNSHVYHDKCPSPQDEDVCPQQAAALDQLFNVGASVSIFVQAPSGIILDFLGPRITCWAGLILFIPGCFMFAYADSITSIDAYMIGFQLLAAGGPFVFISSLPVAQLWPDKKAMILMMINGVYGGGAFVFFLFSLLYNHAHVSMRSLFIGYGILGVLIVVVAGFAWPRRTYATAMSPSTVKDGSSSSRVDEPTTVDIIHKSFKDDPPPSSVAEPTRRELFHKTLRDMRTVHFVYMALLVSFLVFKSNFFLSTYNDQFSLYMSDSQVGNSSYILNPSRYNTIFGVLLPAIGMLAGPIGIFFDKFGVNAALVLTIVLSTISSVCGMMVYSHDIYDTFQIIRIYYPMIYGVWAFALIARFGTTNFGVLYGIIAVLAGILNILASDPLNRSALHSHSYVDVNFMFAVVGFAFILYPLVMGFREYLKNRRRLSYKPITSVQ